MRLEEAYADVLFSIESGIVSVYDDDSELVDSDVIKALDILIAAYEREKMNRDGITPTPTAKRVLQVYEQCRRVCKWQLGLGTLNEGDPGSGDAPQSVLSLAELFACLKRLRKSARRWHKRDGRRGYLTYVRQFVGGASSGLDI